MAHRNILVIRLSSLGDVLLTMPAVHAIKTGLPDVNLSWVVEGSVSELLAHQRFVDRVIDFPRRSLSNALKRGKLVQAGRILTAFVRTLRKDNCELAIDFHGILKSALISRVVRTGKRIGFDWSLAKEGSWMAYDERVNVAEKRMHKVTRNMLLSHLVGGTEGTKINLQGSDEAETYINSFLGRHGISRPLFAVNPFCSKGSEFKRWDLANYGELMRQVGEATNATMVILWGPGEEEEARRLKEMAGSHAVLACPTTVLQLLSLLQKTDLYVGGDTGVMHLAALAHVPVVALFGPTDHLINGPHGDNHMILRKELPCSPCRNKKCKSRECLVSMTVDEVRQEVLAAWKRIREN
jgi:lipopolysaccharide heptosyltransferase I